MAFDREHLAATSPVTQAHALQVFGDLDSLKVEDPCNHVAIALIKSSSLTSMHPDYASQFSEWSAAPEPQVVESSMEGEGYQATVRIPEMASSRGQMFFQSAAPSLEQAEALAIGGAQVLCLIFVLQRQ